MGKCGVLHFDGSYQCIQRLACRAISASAELFVVLVATAGQSNLRPFLVSLCTTLMFPLVSVQLYH